MGRLAPISLLLVLASLSPAQGNSPFDDPACSACGGALAPSSSMLWRFDAERRSQREPDVARSIERGLAWLVDQQGEDGSWGADLLSTSRALLALCGDGNSITRGPHKQAVARGAKWLIGRLDDRSGMFAGGDAAGGLPQALGAVVLVELRLIDLSTIIERHGRRALAPLRAALDAGAACMEALPWIARAHGLAMEAAVVPVEDAEWTAGLVLEELERALSVPATAAEVPAAKAMVHLLFDGRHARTTEEALASLAREGVGTPTGAPAALRGEELLWSSLVTAGAGASPGPLDDACALARADLARRANADGSWGPPPGGGSSVEATALALLCLEAPLLHAPRH